MSCLDWISRRRRADSRAAPPRVEPTLAPIVDRVRLRIRYNRHFAIAVTEHEAAAGVDPMAAWRDYRGDEPSVECVADVVLPDGRWPPGDIAPTPRRAAIDDPPALPPPSLAPHCAAPTPKPAAPSGPPPSARPLVARPLQPTLSPSTHAQRLLEWCRRNGLVGEVLIDDMLLAYGRAVDDYGMTPRAWNPISRELTLMLEGRVGVKRYAMRGASKRRVFYVSAASPSGQSGLPAGAPSRAHDAVELERAAA